MTNLITTDKWEIYCSATDNAYGSYASQEEAVFQELVNYTRTDKCVHTIRKVGTKDGENA